jgi:hypothetical protein
MNALNDLNQPRVEWDCGTSGLGVLVSDSLMFERGEPTPSDAHLGHIYGLVLPLLKRGMPITPVQLENVELPGYLDPFRVLLVTYQGMKPLTPEVHVPLAEWVKRGGALVVVDDDSDPYCAVRDWWNTGGRHCRTPREHLFEQLGLTDKGVGRQSKPVPVGKGSVTWLREHPADLAASHDGGVRVGRAVMAAADFVHVAWRETNYLLLRRGPYLVGAGLDEAAPGAAKVLTGRFINLFDPELHVRTSVALAPASRCFLLDLQAIEGNTRRVLASACKALPLKDNGKSLTIAVEGVANTAAIVLIRASRDASSITLAGQAVADHTYSAADQLLWIRFANSAAPRELVVRFP